MRNALILLAGTHLAAGVVGYQLAPREILDHEVKQTGFFTVDARRVLSTTVDSLHAESSLLVFSYKGSAAVEVERTKWWIFEGHQRLFVPARVNYVLDLTQLTLDKVKYDDRAKLVTVQLPQLMMDAVVFYPEDAQAINEGVLTWNQSQVDALTKQNYASARKAFVKQAQGATIVEAARGEAKKDIQNYFEIPLRIVGHPDVKVVATFEES